MDLTPEELKEVLNIFRAETKEYIKDLNNGFLIYEKKPNDEKNLADIFRTAHSIKGAARMLGLSVIEQVAHELEDTLGLVKNGDLVLDSDKLDIMYEAVDTIENSIEVLSKSETPNLSEIDVSVITNRLRGIQNKEELDLSEQASVASADDGDVLFAPTPSTETPKKEVPASPEPVPEEILEKPTESSKISIDSVRISLDKIDALMLQAGELINTKIRNEQILSELSSIALKFAKFLKRNERKNELADKLNIMFFDALEDLDLNKLSEYEQRTLVDIFLSANTLVDSVSDEITNLVEYHADNTLKTTVLIDELQEQIRETRLLPFSTILNLMPRMVRDIAKQVKKKIYLLIDGEETQIDKHILEEIKDPLIHLIRNCIDHGIESPDERVVEGKKPEGIIEVLISYEGNSVLVEVNDDGAGLDKKRILQSAIKKNLISEQDAVNLNEQEIFNLIFKPGFSTAKLVTDISGRGVGMDIVRTKIEKLKGIIYVSSEKGKGTSFKLRLPLTLATIQVLIVESVEELYTLPIVSTERIIRFSEDEIEKVNNVSYVKVNDEIIQTVLLDNILDQPRRFLSPIKQRTMQDLKRFDKLTAVVIAAAEKKIALIVDRVLDEQEVVIKQLKKQLKSIPVTMGATVLGSGQLSIVLDPVELIKRVHQMGNASSDLVEEEVAITPDVLIVDDSITTRTLEKNILEQEGFNVTVAINGEDAWKVLETHGQFDIMVSDVEMPYMTGLELVKKVKNSRFKSMPCILCTSLATDYDREKGAAAGADAYLTKGTFDQKNLLETIHQLLGVLK